jgi:excisionase family DNA binding protein
LDTDTVPRPLLTRAELADVLRVSTSTVDRLRRRGQIRTVQLARGGRVGFRVEDVEALLEPEGREPHAVRNGELDWR